MSPDVGVGSRAVETTFGEPTTRADTAADRREFLTGGLTPFACRSCGTEVLVRKNSPRHTSIQWRSDPAVGCPLYRERVAEGGSTALMDTCERLSESIALAAAAGEIPTGEQPPGDSSPTRPLRDYRRAGAQSNRPAEVEAS